MQEKIREPIRLSAEVVTYLVENVSRTEQLARELQRDLTELKAQFPITVASVHSLETKIDAITISMGAIIDRLNKLPEEEIKQITKAFNGIKLLIWTGSAILATFIALSEYGSKFLSFLNINPYR
jgi:hypothetical protein